jgi:hypothetical protein
VGNLVGGVLVASAGVTRGAPKASIHAGFAE